MSALALRTLAALDLTCLEEVAGPERIETLCRRAGNRHGRVAAVCVYPEYIRSARAWLDAAGHRGVGVATVANFPGGRDDVAAAVAETTRAVAAGADEVDVVFPWRALLAGDPQRGSDLVRACRVACAGRARLKVILETGELADPLRIREASLIAIEAGADFIKTSTGKVAVNATLDAARVMLQCIAERGGECGFKAAGGIRSLADAAGYFELADRLLGADWAQPARFRIGASGLLDAVLAELDGGAAAPVAGY